jgi:hypothetical protein
LQQNPFTVVVTVDAGEIAYQMLQSPEGEWGSEVTGMNHMTDLPCIQKLDSALDHGHIVMGI